mmetsp:Transcript_22552/g.48842  ORF Transcript_22552/g.48842 Transcript_22552/m.48842 type:complete len:142 (+) Transcript_22552:152-577(+)
MTTHIDIAEHNDAHNNAEGIPQRFLRIPSRSPNLAATNPQNAVDDKQKKVIHDSSALEVTDAAPPRRRLIADTTNSAKKMMPPELPTSWPMVIQPIARVLSLRGLIMDNDEVRRTISIDSRDKLIPRDKPQQNTVKELTTK